MSVNIICPEINSYTDEQIMNKTFKIFFIFNEVVQLLFALKYINIKNKHLRAFFTSFDMPHDCEKGTYISPVRLALELNSVIEIFKIKETFALMFYVRFASFEHKLYFVLIRKSKKLHFPLI
jgi:hypothetical protein